MKNKKLNKKAKKVYVIFQAMGWDYWYGVPTFEDIRSTMKDLAKSASKSEYAATGRIVATKRQGKVEFSIEI